MDRRSRAQQWRRARHNYNDLCPPIGRRAATALLWLSCSIALLRALAFSNARAQQRAAQRRSFLNAHHRSAAAAAAPQVHPAAAQVHPESSESESEHEHQRVAVEPELARPECLEYDQDDFETDSETESDSSIVSETEIETELETELETEPETAPTTEPETEPEDEHGPRGATFSQSLTQRLHALKLQSADASPRRAQPTTQESESASEGEEPQRGPLDQDPRDPEESEERQETRQPRRCKTRRLARRRDQSPESPPRKGPIPIRRH